MSTMYNPPHPGEVLRDGVFADKGLTVTEFAKRLGVTRVALSRVQQRARPRSVSPEHGGPAAGDH